MHSHDTQAKKVGAALVIGGGIGGMQAALDLAASGIKVYLAESKPSIGGVMSQLDKTFPTNDCAMCTQAPRLVEIGRHKDIEILSLSDIQRVKGEPGNFQVTIKKRPRYVDVNKCTGCGLCFSSCPVVMKNEFDFGLSERKAIYTLFPQSVPNKATIDKREARPCKAACMDRCPVHTNVLGYVRLIAAGKFQEAYRMNRDVNPLPSVCGRVCYAPCEQACNRSQLDEPIAIRQLKMFLADANNIDELPVPIIAKTGKKVAVIGSGPAGLAVANDLALAGHAVTVFEAQPEPGGMLRYGIPEYRLPRETLRKEIGYIEKLGVEIKCGVQVGKDIKFSDLRKDYQAIFIGVGAQGGMTLDGADLPGVTDGIQFLRAVNLGLKVQIGKKVAVVGGGNTAIDCARTAKRLGAEEVRIVYRRSRAEMPAAQEEVEAAEDEGIKLDFLTLPTRFLDENSKLSAMECTRMELGAPDASGRRKPIPIAGSEFKSPVDTVIPALGQVTEISFLNSQIELTKNGMVKINSVSGATSVEGIFAGGDVVTGASYVIDAIAAGKKAARSINNYLRGEAIDTADGQKLPEKQPERLTDEEVSVLKRRFLTAKRAVMRELPVEQRITNFQEVALGFDPEQAIAEAKRCLAGQIDGCIECGECLRKCDANAINFADKEQEIELNVGAIIATPGFDSMDGRLKPEYGYGKFPNVISAIEFERLLSASGPHGGHVLRPSDEAEPKKIAFIQCVGSRDCDRDYCSSVCCMYATKEAILAKEHIGEHVACDIFFIDLRAFSKGFDEYYQRAQKLGINYIRCRPSGIEENPASKNLRVAYVDSSEKKKTQEYDLVVLSTGLQAPKAADALSKSLGIELNEYHFAATEEFSPINSSREGVFVAGAFTGPKDIPESVIEASAAVASSMEILAPAKGQQIVKKELPPELSVAGEDPRIGVFVCRCGTNIGSVVDVEKVAEYAKTLPNVVHAQCFLYTCANDTQEIIKSVIAEQKLNRVVVAACTPRTHEPLFQNTIREAGLNPYLFEMSNIRDQCSWVHMREPEKATKKAKDLVRIALAKARLIEPLQRKQVPINKNVLVIGGGIAGMTSALTLARQGFEVHLVEKQNALGGNTRRVRHLLPSNGNGDGTNPAHYIARQVEKIKSENKIHLHLAATITAIEGFTGNFVTKVQSNGAPTTIQHGAIVVATGAEEYKPTEYLYGTTPNVMTQLELEEKLFGPSSAIPDTVVMIQCVGSRDTAHPYCSRICCSQAIKNALKIKELKPSTNVYVLYRDIRTYGFADAYYTKARKLGVVFSRYEEDRKPDVALSEKGGLCVRSYDPIIREEFTIDSGWVVLSAGTVSNATNKELAQMLKTPLDQNGFFLEAHMKLRPVDFATEGIFLCGMAHYPKTVRETIGQAGAAAARAAVALANDTMELAATLSQVIDDNCDGCAYCVDPCPYKAISLIEYMRDGATKKTVEINESLCKGCGVCQATCPKLGVVVRGFKMDQLMAMVHAAVEPQPAV